KTRKKKKCRLMGIFLSCRGGCICTKMQTREWRENLEGLETFMHQAYSTPLAQECGKMFCPCWKCNNSKLTTRENVWKHLVNRGFTPQYYIWFQHGECYNYVNEASSSNSNFQDEPVDHLHN